MGSLHVDAVFRLSELEVMGMSPFEIGILLHYYGCASDHPYMNNKPPIFDDTMREFVKDGLLEHGATENPQYVGTKKLAAYVEYLCSVQLPEQIWIVNMPTSTPRSSQNSIAAPI